MTTERELAEVFAPCHLAGHADNLAALYKERAILEGSIKSVKKIVMDASLAGADMNTEPPFRRGAIIEGAERVDGETGEVKTVRWQAVWHLDKDSIGWHPELEPVR